MMARLMTLAEAAAELHETITINTLRRAIREKRLPASKYGTNRYYVKPEDIEEYLSVAKGA